MPWLLDHADVVAAFANVGMFLVWVVYANFFYRDFRRERRPLILIDQMSGPGEDSTCTLANLSRRVVYLECVLVVAHCGERCRTALVTDRAGLSSIDQNERRIVSTARQGPVASGQLISVGSMTELAGRALAASGDSLDSVRTIELRVVATMGTEDHPVGASKRFDVDLSGECLRSRPARLGTRQLYRRRDRSRVRCWIEGDA